MSFDSALAEDGGVTKAKVLCIEDDQDMIDYIKLILGKAGYEVIGADGGVRGLEAMRQEQPDLVLLDLMMPGMDGAEVLLRKGEDDTIRHIPVIALTALNSPFDQIMWLARTDLQDFIVKSKLPRRELIARIERVLQLHSPPPNESAV
ncbi:MAG TPA: response regulator [Anaerolineae bacterium]|nr:response regulator [Anaerolineae bacterium]